MTYTEFKKTYRWTIKEFPDTTQLFRDDLGQTIGTCETIRFTKVGKKWIETETRSTEMTIENYFNIVDAVPFFRRLSGSRGEKITKAYTKYGLIPVEIDSLSPDRTEKVIRRFTFK